VESADNKERQRLSLTEATGFTEPQQGHSRLRCDSLRRAKELQKHIHLRPFGKLRASAFVKTSADKSADREVGKIRDQTRRRQTNLPHKRRASPPEAGKPQNHRTVYNDGFAAQQKELALNALPWRLCILA